MEISQFLTKNIKRIEYRVDLDAEDVIPITENSYQITHQTIFSKEEGKVKEITFLDNKLLEIEKETSDVLFLEETDEKIYGGNIDRDHLLDIFDIVSDYIDTDFVRYDIISSFKTIESDFGRLLQKYNLYFLEILDRNTSINYYVSFFSLSELKSELKKKEYLENDKFKLDTVDKIIIPSYLLPHVWDYLVEDYFKYIEGKPCEKEQLYKEGKIGIINEPPLELYDDFGSLIGKEPSKIILVEKPTADFQQIYYFPKIISDNIYESLEEIDGNLVFIDYFDEEGVSASYLKGIKISEEELDEQTIEKIFNVIYLDPKDLIDRIVGFVGNYVIMPALNKYVCFFTELSFYPIEIRISIPEYTIIEIK